MRLSDVTLIVRNKPHDFILEHVDLDLEPRSPGELRVDKLQLPAGQGWTKISAQTSYANRNLVLHDLLLDNEDRFRVLNFDASQIGAKTLTINVDSAIGGGTLSGSITMTQTSSSLNTKVRLLGETIAATALNKYLDLPEGFIGGQIERVRTDERLKQIHVVEQTGAHLKAPVGGQHPEFIRALDARNDFQALIDKAHQRRMQLEEQLGFVRA